RRFIGGPLHLSVNFEGPPITAGHRGQTLNLCLSFIIPERDSSEWCSCDHREPNFMIFLAIRDSACGKLLLSVVIHI
ncbi:hypothetical protein NQ317_007573, partial [Molorchus minor]